MLRNRTINKVWPDIYVFKKDSLQSRTSFVVGDSFDNNAQADRNESSSSEMIYANRFLPWEVRDLMLVNLLKTSTDDFNELSVDDLGGGLKIDSNNILTFSPKTDYVELQFWGKINLDNVKAFIFRTAEPEGSFLAALQSKGIRIYRNDGENDILWWAPNQTIQAQHPPLGKLQPTNRPTEGSNGGRWFTDRANEEWFLKPDKSFSQELQSSAEVISAAIYRHFGYTAPETYIVEIDGVRYSAAKSLGNNLKTSVNLSTNTSNKFRQMRAVAAYLIDWDRMQPGPNNFDLGNNKFAVFDFGGTLGARARGGYKSLGPFISDAVGSFSSGEKIEDIWNSFDVRKLPATHPWLQFNKDDATAVVKMFQNLTDSDIDEIVNLAKYSNANDSNYMKFELKKRRNILISNLLKMF